MAPDPTSTAVVLIEFQNDFTSDGGALHGAVQEVMESTDMLANTKRLVDEARAAGAAPLFRGQQGYSPHLDPDGTWTRHHLDADGKPLRDLQAYLVQIRQAGGRPAGKPDGQAKHRHLASRERAVGQRVPSGRTGAR